jgi:hypothetical protein
LPIADGVAQTSECDPAAAAPANANEADTIAVALKSDLVKDIFFLPELSCRLF